MRLKLVELRARNLDNFTGDNPSLIKSTQLFDWETGRQIWPPPQQSFAAAMVAGMAFPSHTRGIGGFIGPGWETEEMRQRFHQLNERDRADCAAYYQRETEKQEERQNAEERERFVNLRR